LVEVSLAASFAERSGVVYLQELFSSHISKATAVGRDGLQARNLSADAIQRLVESTSVRLLDGSYSFAAYRQILKLKGAGKPPRQVAIPTLRDRLVMRMLVELIRDHFSLPEPRRAHQLVREARVSFRSAAFTDYVRLDLVNFYPSIPHATISKFLETGGAGDAFIRLVLSAAGSPVVADGAPKPTNWKPNKGVPAGLSLANVLGELVLHSIDDAYVRRLDVKYFRYVDDLMILTKHGKRVAVRNEVIDAIEALGLKSHTRGNSDKFASGKIASSSVQFLGYTFEPSGVTVEMSRTAKLTSSISRPITMLRHALRETDDPQTLAEAREKAEWWCNLVISGCVSDKRRRGWLAYYSQIDDLGRLKQLDAITSKLMIRIPESHRFVPKTFMKSFTMIRNPSRDRSGYILDFDDMNSEQQRETLRIASRYRTLPSDPEKVERLFRRFVGMAVSALETDVGSPS